MKKVLLVIIDALATRIVEPAMQDGRLKTFSSLAAAGVFRTDSISIFPSITPAATASLMTGRYPVDHGIAGAFWYERDADCVAYYGDDVWVVMNEGFGKYFNDFLVSLNFTRLQSETVFERVENAGMTAAVLNYMWFRGGTRHEVNAPLLLQLLPGTSFVEHISGPTIAALGDFVTSRIPGSDETLSASGGFMRRYGFHDETTGEYLLQLARTAGLPDFTLAYFPNNDWDSHSVGPAEAASTVERVDEILGELIESCGGLDAFLAEYAIVITGDHSQCDMAESADDRPIDLDELLEGFDRVPAGSEWGDENDLMVCPNLRAAQIYFHRASTPEHRDEVGRRLLSHSHVDQVLWVEPFRCDRIDSYEVRTADRGRLSFSIADEGSESDCFDRYGNHWSIEGDLSAIDATIGPDGQIHYGIYPNALERIVTGFCNQCGDIWATARPGSEFCLSETSVHAGGSHGTLHELDSTSPLLVAGAPGDITVPEHPRNVDVTPLCLRILGIDQ
ncbi:Type I phosphodiesterase / nucleotide pyrophosphatase [Maioricimonas rarisocia]|uniref:Type I phosphodiesterase / nucleotide pyrophosphatase n=1 Tax=Maioricimonas rarisocia TaxID=2528026 RepID=A0A517Z4T3_9PLAN|nr:nucleotide pyrophosphatase/phosphodiesterase family protein [Maioricimonas rarisocia]QDU37502.1 Type I phosphodiesterase / nucleotide pyrophosphatase [Maioricimonas rarisocia]